MVAQAGWGRPRCLSPRPPWPPHASLGARTAPGPPRPGGEAGGPASRERGEKSPRLLIWLLSPCCDPMAGPAWRGSALLLQQPLSEAPSLAENVLIL